MTTGTDDISLGDALAAWQPMLEQPTESWFFCENSETVQAVLAVPQARILKDQVTTLKSFARKLVADQCPDIHILSVEEQTAIIHSIIDSLPKNTKPKSVSIALIHDLIGRFNFFRQHFIDITQYLDDTIKPKHQLLATIFSQYEQYCGESMLDDIGVMKKAVELLGNTPVASGIIYHIQPADLLTQTLLDAVAASPNVLEFKPQTCQITAPKTLQYPIRKYRTAKEEIKATLETISLLLEAGTCPYDILIISPSMDAASALIASVIDDFYYVKDGTYLPLKCTNLETPLFSFPIIQCVTAALQAALNNQFALQDLQTVTSSPYFPNHKSISIDALTTFAVTANVSEHEFEWRKAIDRMKHDEKNVYTANGIGYLIDWLKQLDDTNEKIPTFRSRTRALKRWLNKAGWMNCSGLSDMEKKAHDHLFAYFSSFTDTPAGDLPCDAYTYLTNLREFLQNASVSAYVDRADAIRLCRLRDAADQTAKYVFIIGLTSAAIPLLMSTLSPFSMRETAELCRRPDGKPFKLSEVQYELEYRNFAAALRTASKTLTLSCHAFDGSSNTSPSSFLTQLDEPKEAETISITHSVWYDQVEAGTAIKEQTALERPLLGLNDPEKTAEIIEREICGYTSDFSTSAIKDSFAATLENHVFSATEIETYLLCPYRWYLEKYVKLHNPQETYSEHKESGSLVHEALEQFISQHAETLKTMSDEAAEQAVLACVKSVFDRYQFISSPTWSAKIKMFLGTAYEDQVSVFRQFAADETNFARDGWFSIPTIRDPETRKVIKQGDLEYRLKNVTVTHKEDTMTVNGSIDRVMRKNDGTFRIVDYKTGKIDSKDMDWHVQIPLYAEAFAVEHPDMTCDGGWYLCLKNTKEYGPVKPNQSLGDDGEESWSDTRDRVLDTVFAAKRNMQKGIMSRTPDCKENYCPFKDICRKTNLADDEGDAS